MMPAEIGVLISGIIIIILCIWFCVILKRVKEDNFIIVKTIINHMGVTNTIEYYTDIVKWDIRYANIINDLKDIYPINQRITNSTFNTFTLRDTRENQTIVITKKKLI